MLRSEGGFFTTRRAPIRFPQWPQSVDLPGDSNRCQLADHLHIFPIEGWRLPHDEPDQEVVKQILNYFVRNPQAADSLEGVARWRLLQEQVHHNLGQTETALKWLVSQGYLEEIPISGTARIFRLAAKRQTEAANFLDKPPEEKGR